MYFFKKNLTLLLLSAVCLSAAACDQHDYLAAVPVQPVDKQKVKGKTYNPKIDILFVVDNSGSMDSHQTTLSRNIALFTNEIFKSKTLDFHIGVVTSTADGNFGSTPGTNGILVGNPNYIDKNTPNGVSLLASDLMVGTMGSGSEMFFDPVVLALSSANTTGPNIGFYRPDAYLAVIFITDAEDQSSRTHTPQDFYNSLLALKSGAKEKILSYGAIIPTGDRTGCPRDDGSVTPLRIEKFFQLTGGALNTTYYSLCDPQYGVKLAGVGADIVMKTGRYMFLDRRPIIETIKVTFGTQVVPEDPKVGWSFNPSKNAIELGDGIVWSSQPPNTAVEVTFDPATDDEP